MASKAFELNKDELYIACHRPFKSPNPGIIRVYELHKPDKHNMVTNMDWSYKPQLIDPNSKTGFNSLQINGQPVVFNKLVDDLCRSRLRVNRRGYCYFQLREGMTETSEGYGITFYRMNDLWNWGDYGVKVDLFIDNTVMNWGRMYILDGGKPALVSGHHDTEMEAELELIRSQLEEKTDEANNLKIQISNRDVENKALMNQVQMLNSDIGKKSAENVVYAEQVKLLQAALEDARKYPPPATSDTKKRAVPSDVFILKSIPFAWPNYNTYTMYWTVTLGVPRILTPTHKHVAATFPMPLSFNLIPGESFDVDHWFYMRVKERTAPILVYEGNAFSLTVGGHTMTSPITNSTTINWGEYVDRRQEHFDFAPVALVGYGTRIAILQW